MASHDVASIICRALGRGGTVSSVRSLAILPTNDAPTIPATAKAISVNEDFNITSTFDGATDSDSTNLTFRVTCAPSLGSVYMAGLCNLNPVLKAPGCSA